MKSIKKVKIPNTNADVYAILIQIIAEYDTPLLLSKEDMKKVKMQINFQEDNVTVSSPS